MAVKVVRDFSKYVLNTEARFFSGRMDSEYAEEFTMVPRLLAHATGRMELSFTFLSIIVGSTSLLVKGWSSVWNMLSLRCLLKGE